MSDFSDMLSKAKKMREEMQKAQESIKKIQVEGVSGGNSVKVVLSGDGGDEVFLGYNRYLLARKINKFKNFSPKSLRKLVRLVLKLFPSKYYDEISQPFQKLFGIPVTFEISSEVFFFNFSLASL